MTLKSISFSVATVYYMIVDTIYAISISLSQINLLDIMYFMYCNTCTTYRGFLSNFNEWDPKVYSNVEMRRIVEKSTIFQNFENKEEERARTLARASLRLSSPRTGERFLRFVKRMPKPSNNKGRNARACVFHRQEGGNR